MNLTLSSPVQLILTAAIVSSAVAVLRPDPVDLPSSDLAQSKRGKPRQAGTPNPVDQAELEWKRAAVPEPSVPNASPMSVTDVPPLPTGSVPAADAAGTPPLPPPAEPAQPDITYLGRMVKDGKVQIFLASRGQPFVLRQGEALDGTWLVQSISERDVTLRHAGSGETRLIPTGNANPLHRPEAQSTQIGPHFLATSAPQHQVEN